MQCKTTPYTLDLLVVVVLHKVILQELILFLVQTDLVAVVVAILAPVDLV